MPCRPTIQTVTWHLPRAPLVRIPRMNMPAFQLLTPPLLAGEIVIYDALNLSVLNAISAHTSAPTVCAFNPEGTLLATASAKGTVIRIFSVPSGEKLLTLRRGSYPTVIYCIAFSQDSSFVCASSETGRGWLVCLHWKSVITLALPRHRAYISIERLGGNSPDCLTKSR